MLSCMKFHTAYLSISLFAVGCFAQMPQERRILVTPNAEHPQIAKESGLGGTVRVGVTVDQAGNVLSVGEATGPGNVCPSVTRDDVIALREAARTAAISAKFAPSAEATPSVVFLNFDFPTESSRFAVRAERVFTASNAPTDYQGRVNAGGSEAPATRETNNLPRQISGGVLNGKAMSLPKPPYPPAARAVRASGAVSIQVLIDEDGQIFSASAISGHPLLRAAARNAACGAVFTPTLLMGNPVKVSGVITYNFVP